MSVLPIINTIISAGCYLIVAFFLFATIKVFLKTKNIQDAILHSVIMIPFILRILHLK